MAAAITYTIRDLGTFGGPAGVAYCWGYNVQGELGDGTITNRLVPTPVAGPM